jgi:site-specific DNA-methyltransferase (adenine-specific)
VAETFLDGKVELHCGDCLEVMPTLPENSVDLVACDPPYHLQSIVDRFGKEGAAPAQDERQGGAFARKSRGFMGQDWDGGDIAFRPEVWRQALRVLKPGGFLLAHGSSRGYGRMQVAIEDAGFETRDCVLEILDTDPRVAAFVNSLDDAQRVAFLQIAVESSDVGGLLAWIYGSGFPHSHNVALDFEKELCTESKGAGGVTVWHYVDDGVEMAREAPFRSDMANAWAGYGSALKPAFEPIVMARKPMVGSIAENVRLWGTGAINLNALRVGKRYPSNVIHDGSAAVLGAFPAETGKSSGGGMKDLRNGGKLFGGAGSGLKNVTAATGYGDSGSAARFYYSRKADADDRLGSKHPTVKPVDEMQYLVRGFSAPGQVVLDMFAGTGTTGEAAFREGRRAILIERHPPYQADIRRRMALCLAGPDERKRESIKAAGDEKPFGADSLFAGLVV